MKERVTNIIAVLAAHASTGGSATPAYREAICNEAADVVAELWKALEQSGPREEETIDPVTKAGGCRCRDCQHCLVYDTTRVGEAERKLYICNRTGTPIELDDFCSRGEESDRYRVKKVFIGTEDGPRPVYDRELWRIPSRASQPYTGAEVGICNRPYDGTGGQG